MKPRCWKRSRNPWVRRGCNGSGPGTVAGTLSMTTHLGAPPKNGHAASSLAMTSSSFWLDAGQTKQRLEYDSTMISARTNLRLPGVARECLAILAQRNNRCSDVIETLAGLMTAREYPPTSALTMAPSSHRSAWTSGRGPT
jgi:hypothetical protein